MFIIMEINIKKQIIKYLYFMFIGVIIGYIIGHCGSRNNIIDIKPVQSRIYESDTTASVNGWYGDEFSFEIVSDQQ